jgi:DNA topoisomerase II
VALHPEHNMWIPEMIFGHLSTSSNYDTNEKKIVGGKNGFGFKLVLIWSTYGEIETVDHVRGLSYAQEFLDNLNVIEEPIVRKVGANVKAFTRVTFIPDYQRLGMPNGLTADMINDCTISWP